MLVYNVVYLLVAVEGDIVQLWLTLLSKRHKAPRKVRHWHGSVRIPKPHVAVSTLAQNRMRGVGCVIMIGGDDDHALRLLWIILTSFAFWRTHTSCPRLSRRSAVIASAMNCSRSLHCW